VTHNQMLTMLYQMAGVNSNDTDEVNRVRLGIRRALGQASRSIALITHRVNIEQTLTASDFDYALATSDRNGNAITISAFDTRSFRTKNRYGITWLQDSNELDELDPKWMDAALQDTGEIETITYDENQLICYRSPGASFVASNPKLYYRAYRQMYRPSADGTAAGSGEVEWTDEIDFPFSDYHDGFLMGALYWTKLLQRYPDEARDVEREHWGPFRMELQALSPAQGMGVDQMPPSVHFVSSSLTGGSPFGEDYGNRS